MHIEKHNRTKNTCRGFTFLEALIYIGLFSFVLGGALLSAYQIFDGTAQIQKMALKEAELNFVLRKLDWALSGSEINSPSLGFSDTTLVVEKDGNEYTFSVDVNNTMYLQKNTETPEPLTGKELSIATVLFEHVNDTPDMLDITFTITGEVTPIKIKRYVRDTI